jgi:hypothetical protein
MSKMKDLAYKLQYEPGSLKQPQPTQSKTPMPTPMLKKFAEEAKLPLAKVEEKWDEAKKIAAEKVGKDSPKYWAFTTSILKKMLGLSKSTFKESLELLEAPLHDVSYHSSDDPGAFSDVELKLIHKFMKDGTYKKKLAKLPFDLYVYIVDDKETGKIGILYPEGKIKKEIWKDQIESEYQPWSKSIKMDIPVFQAAFEVIRQRIKKNPQSVHFVMGDNFSKDNQISPTPWMIAHRLCHTFQPQQDFFDIIKNTDFIKFIAKLHKSNPTLKIDRVLEKSLPMKSVKSDKFDDTRDELRTEIATQFIVTGDVTVDEKFIRDQLGSDLSNSEFNELIDGWKKTIDHLKELITTDLKELPGNVFYI